MAFLSSINIVGSGMLAQQIRLDVISENVTNMDTTRTESGGPYRRKIVRFEAETNKNGFRKAMQRAWQRYATGTATRPGAAGGVRVTEIAEDESDFPFRYDPDHPDADEAGYVQMPNITLVKEVTDAMAASQAYNADVTVFNTLKQVISAGIEIGV